MSKEHVFPKSLRDSVSESHEHEYRRAYDDGAGVKGQTSNRPVNLFDVSSRRVCTDCNNGWMSELEVDANPILRRLIAGERQIDANETDVVRYWLAKTAVVAHFAEPGSDSPQAVAVADRRRVRDGFVPCGWRVLLGSLDPSWRNHKHRGVVRGPKQRYVDGQLITEIFHCADLEIGCFIGLVIGCPPGSDAGPQVTEYLAEGMRRTFPFLVDISAPGPAHLTTTWNPVSEKALNEIAIVWSQGLSSIGE